MFNDQSAAYDLQFLQTRAWASGSWAFDNNEINTTGKTKSHRHVSVWAESLWLGEGQSRRPSSLFTEAQIPVTIQKLLIRTQISSSDTALHWRDRKSPCLYDAYRAFKCTVMGAKHRLFSKSHEVSRFFLWAVGQKQKSKSANDLLPYFMSISEKSLKGNSKVSI